MDVLALDLSKSGTGWARYRTGDAVPTFGTWPLGTAYTDRGGMMVNLYKKLTEAFLFGEPDLVTYESPLRGDAQSTEANNRIANANASLVEFICKARRIRCTEHGNTAWKKAYLGSGRRMSREEAKAASIAMSKFFGMRVADDNQADALGLLDYALTFEKILPPWRRDAVLVPDVRRAAV